MTGICCKFSSGFTEVAGNWLIRQSLILYQISLLIDLIR
jgi:hypothetical protein